MADSLLTDLTALTAPDKDDPVYITDDPAVTPLDRKITLENLFKVINTFTAEAAPVAGDYIAVYDTSASAARRVLVSSIMAVSHNHAASEVTSGTLTHERGGLEADVSAYSGLVKITSGTTSAITVTSAAESVLDDATTGAMLTTLGIGSVENTALSTWAGTANITTLGTVTTGTWNGTALEGAAIASTGETGGTKFLREDGDGSCSWQAGAGGGSTEGTAVLSTGETGGTKFLREDGDGSCSWQAAAGAGDALTSNGLDQFAATTSAELAGVISDETGSGALAFATSPTLVTPVLGTPSSGALGSCTAYEGTAVASTGETGGTKFLREDGDGTCSWQAAGSTSSSWYDNTDGATITIDGANGKRQMVTLGGNRNIEWTGLTEGDAILLRVIQDGSGSRLVSSWGSNATINWPGATNPTLTTTASQIDILGFLVIDATTDAEVIEAVTVAQDIAP